MLAVGALALSACQDVPEPTTPAALTGAPSLSQGQTVPGRFIVTVRDGSAATAVASAHGVSPDFVYGSALNGFAGSMSAAARDGLMADSRVVRVEPDRVMTIFAEQANATWGLDRVDQRSGLSGTYVYNKTGAGVNAYIIDTGIWVDHPDFSSRASSGFDAVDGGTADDCNGHGTHVAGTTGGSEWGIAKDVDLIAVRVLDCGGSGTTSGVIAGIDWVTANHVKPAVANMSLGGGASSTLDAAVQNSIAAGISYSVAAGNGNMGGKAQDACGYSPARVPEAITIGATTQTDAKTSWSNYGDCVDWFAPGYQITSAWINDDYSGDGSFSRTISGTSMSAPHVAGAVALYLETNTGASPQTVRDALYSYTTKGIVTSSSTANNHLLYTLETVDDGSGGGDDGGGDDGGGDDCNPNPAGICRN